MDRAASRELVPWSTFVINTSGCFAVGFVIVALVDRHRAPEWLRVGLVVGFCGGYTTFSTFAQETLDLVEARDTWMAIASVTASVLVGVAALLAGTRVGRLVWTEMARLEGYRVFGALLRVFPQRQYGRSPWLGQKRGTTVFL